MDAKKPPPIQDFPLQPKKAREILITLATEYTHYIRYSKHAKERMVERGVTNKQVFDILRSRYSRITEGPAPTPTGTWKLNLLGFSSGESIELVIDLKRLEDAPTAYLVTVIVK